MKRPIEEQPIAAGAGKRSEFNETQQRRAPLGLLTFRILRPFARFVPTIFFALNRAWITRDETGFFKRWTKVSIEQH